MTTLYLSEYGANLKLKDNRLIIKKSEETLKKYL